MFEPLPADRVVYEDAAIIVVNKPAPLLTQAPPLVPSLEAMVKSYLKATASPVGSVYLAVPQRLDRPVSGVIVFAKTPAAARKVHRQFEYRKVDKVYWAIVAGELSEDSGVWTDWLIKRADEAHVDVVPPDTPGAQVATLGYRILNRISDRRLQLELSPTTGRMHQLRVQCAVRGLPILGDEQYGSSVPFGPVVERPRDRVIALHARRLSLWHPDTKDRLTFEAPPPAEWPLPINPATS
jgi:23S rRNA pseudouridine1911/1915/1917 synthase